MNLLQALILGIIQGITEFLPVSSSTHLALAKRFMSIEHTEAMVYFDLLCHLGTLLAVILVLWKDLLRALSNFRSFSFFALALFPLIPAYFFLKPLRLLLAQETWIFLFCTSALLFFASRERKPTLNAHLKWSDMLWIGIAQSMALLPGISRSGSTIAAARILGWEWKEAARFSFLLAIPTIFGGSLLETIRTSPIEIAWNLCAIGFGASFIVGLGAIKLLFWILDRGTLRPFAWYCLAIGFLSLVVLR